jgi:hypothetical protein
MHFLSSLLRIKGLYLCRALLANRQEALHKAALGILLECYVSWLLQDLKWNYIPGEANLILNNLNKKVYHVGFTILRFVARVALMFS